MTPEESIEAFKNLMLEKEPPETEVHTVGYLYQEGTVKRLLEDQKAVGRKDDNEKPDYTLLTFRRALDAEVMVLMFGAKKYARDGWRKVPDAKQRYLAAIGRHYFALLAGEENDPESGLPHEAHIACSTHFRLELIFEEKEKKNG